MNEEAHRVLKRLETLAKKESLPSIGPIKGKVIADVIQDNKPRRVIEIGTLFGYSAILIGHSLLRILLHPIHLYYTQLYSLVLDPLYRNMLGQSYIQFTR